MRGQTRTCVGDRSANLHAIDVGRLQVAFHTEEDAARQPRQPDQLRQGGVDPAPLVEVVRGRRREHAPAHREVAVARADPIVVPRARPEHELARDVGLAPRVGQRDRRQHVHRPRGRHDLCANQTVSRVPDNSSLSHFSARTRDLDD